MTELEDRLRMALVERAADFTASPDAWERTTARARRPLRLFTSGMPGRRGLTRFTPLAAAAVIVAVAISTAALASSGGWRDLVSSPATASSPVTPPWYWQLGPIEKPLRDGKYTQQQLEVFRRRMWVRSWLRTQPMCGGLVGPVTSFDKTNVWFSQATGSYQGTYLCSSSSGGSLAGPAGLGRGVLANAFGWDSGEGSSGDAVNSVTSVTAVLANGRSVTGRVWRGRGLPFGLWQVSYPLTDPAALVFRNATGRVVATLHVQNDT